VFCLCFNVFVVYLMIDLECINSTLNPNNFVELCRLIEHKLAQPVANFLLECVYINNPWDTNFQHKLPFESMEKIKQVAKTCSHLRTYMKTCLEYYAVKVAFIITARLLLPFWNSQQDYAVYHARENWRHFKKLEKYSNVPILHEELLPKPVKDKSMRSSYYSMKSWFLCIDMSCT
jgi:hypothetical protein